MRELWQPADARPRSGSLSWTPPSCSPAAGAVPAISACIRSG